MPLSILSFSNIDVNLQCGPEYSVVVFVLHTIIRVRMLSVQRLSQHTDQPRLLDMVSYLDFGLDGLR